MQKTIAEINHYSNITVNPLTFPEQTYELYSVPSYDSSFPEIIQGKEIGSTKVAIEENDVLVCKINPRINRVWVVKHYTQHPLIASSEWIVIRSPENDCEYLKWYFRSPKFQRMMVSQVTGIGGSLTRAQPKQVATYPVPLPDLPTQLRIAATLDKVSEGIALCRQILADLDELVKSQFIEVIQPLLDTGKTIPLGELVDSDRPITYGILKPGTGFPGGVPVIKVKDMKDGLIDQTDLLLTSPEIDNNYKRSRLRAGDLLVSIRGSVGRMAEVPENLENANITQDTARLTIKKEYNKVFVRGVAVKGINIGYLRELGIPVCERHKQDELAALYVQSDKSKFAVQQQLAQLETLKKSLMQEYFG